MKAVFIRIRCGNRQRKPCEKFELYSFYNRNKYLCNLGCAASYGRKIYDYPLAGAGIFLAAAFLLNTVNRPTPKIKHL